MLIRNDKGFYTLSTWNQFKDLINAFSTREFGNMKPLNTDQAEETKRNLVNFAEALGVSRPKFVKAEQVHGAKIAIVGEKDEGKLINGVDGLVTKETNLFLAIFVADCFPIVAYDPDKEVVGVAHAGWQGTSLGIAKNLISSFVEMGSSPKNIRVGVGPGIEFCHYEVKRDVADKFKAVGLAEYVMISISGKIYVDLKGANIKQLEDAGIKKENIDVSVKACTYENNDFYSYRREKENWAGETAAVIGLPGGR